MRGSISTWTELPTREGAGDCRGARKARREEVVLHGPALWLN